MRAGGCELTSSLIPGGASRTRPLRCIVTGFHIDSVSCDGMLQGLQLAVLWL